MACGEEEGPRKVPGASRGLRGYPGMMDALFGEAFQERWILRVCRGRDMDKMGEAKFYLEGKIIYILSHAVCHLWKTSPGDQGGSVSITSREIRILSLESMLKTITELVWL